MTKRRFAGPVKVETRRNRSRKREPRTSPQPIIVADRTMFKPAPVRQNEVQAPPCADGDKNAPTASPRPGALADEFAQIFRHGRVPKWMWSPASA